MQARVLAEEMGQQREKKEAKSKALEIANNCYTHSSGFGARIWVKQYLLNRAVHFSAFSEIFDGLIGYNFQSGAFVSLVNCVF